MSKRTVTVTAAEAQSLQDKIRALGPYDHVEVHARRGHLVIEPDPDDPVARVTPAGAGCFGLSFRSHTGRWETMPATGNLEEIATAAVEMLGPYLVRMDFSRRT